MGLGGVAANFRESRQITAITGKIPQIAGKHRCRD
jgi:hypothetical protein